MRDNSQIIDPDLVRSLIAAQFPQWATLQVRPVAHGGWDNRTFHLGDKMLVRMPSAEEYAAKVEIEQKWLPKLAPHLPLSIPAPIAMGRPDEGYPWNWSIYAWIDGETVARAPVADMNQLAIDLAHFLKALHVIDTSGGPVPGLHNFYRGGALATYDAETRQAIAALKNDIKAERATELWDEALATKWEQAPVWVHGDISPGNLLVRDGKLCAVIDFGGLAVGDPACDLAIAWTFLNGESREVFQKALSLDENTWLRGKAWTLWKALITAAGSSNSQNYKSVICRNIIEDLLG